MKVLLTSILVVLITFSAPAQKKLQKIILDVTSTDLKVYQSVMLTAKLISEGNPDTKLEVMVYGEALPMLMKNQSNVANEIAKYIDNNNVVLTACELSMDLLNVNKNQLLDGVGTVENAVVEIVSKQTLGWGYIKSGN